MDNMPKGYKKTEVGIIPEDWEVRKLGDIGDVKMCRRIFSYQTRDFDEVPFYKIGTFGKEPDAYISRELFQKYRKLYDFPNIGDILISASGTIGRTVVYDGKDAYFQDSNIIWIGNNEKLVSNNFLNYAFQQVEYDTEGGTIKRLYNSILKRTKFARPLPKEQYQISNTLSDVDALITSLEKLIDKKKMLKQGVMQELLTGKRRLPGFKGEWKNLSLGDFIRVEKGSLITSRTLTKGKIPVIAGGKEPAYYHNEANRPANTITISASGANAGFVNFFDIPIFASDCSTISESPKYNVQFIYFWLKLNQNEIYKRQTGGAQPHIHPSDIEPMKIMLPSSKEQSEIALFISDLGLEIDSLKAKLYKLKQIKQGAMQQLLTGKIRLINK